MPWLPAGMFRRTELPMGEGSDVPNAARPKVKGLFFLGGR